MNLFEYTYNLVRQIPKGKLSTYGAVAQALGDIHASRAVGHMMNQNPDPDDMPCYKIIHSDGRLGGFGRGIKDKIKRLKQDNILVEDGKIVDFNSVLFNDFKTDYPLKKLRDEQIKLSKKLILKDDFKEIKTVAGIDVAYPKNEFEDVCGACVIMDYKTKQIVEEKTVFAKTYFPFISTYLAYRELPVVEKLFKNLRTTPTILMLDGNGILHPYGFGLASHVGVVLDIPTIGVAKTLLYGKLEGDFVKINNKKRGYALRYPKKNKRPIYVSPGHRISFETSVDVVKHFSFYRIPEPLRQAHILANKTLKIR
ncbi:MAG: endonuclease V [Candidatus Thermoplasmatota archaeon]|jgi:deoxyribonuclease V|nr:endonuclease V [Candidatus Thermoplasmatota archaeon]